MTLFQRIFTFGLFGLLSVSIYAQDTEEEKRVFINNEATVNSDQLEFSPAFFEDGIVFISSKVSEKKYKVKDKRINQNVMSIFLSRRAENGLLEKPVPFSKSLLSSSHEGPITFDRTAENIFFTRNNVRKGKQIKAKDGFVKMKIYSAELVGDEWTNVEDLPFNDDQFNTVHPSVSVEGDILYFASDREGGMGGMDIWMVKRMGDSWSEPINLGPTVNTDSNEIFPFIHADGTLYFASNGHPGFGGLDIFFSKPGVEWSTPKNLGAPFNSEQDDLGFIIDRDKKNGYFSSSRSGGYGQDDIYSFYVNGNLDELFDEDNRPKVMRSFILAVSDDSGATMLEGAKVSYTNLDNLSITKVIADGQTDADVLAQLSNPNNDDLILRVPMNEMGTSGVTDSWGKFPVDLTTGNYAFVIEKDGYKPQQIILDTEAGNEEIFVNLAPITAADLASNGNNGSNGSNGSTTMINGTNPNSNGSNGSNSGINTGTDYNGTHYNSSDITGMTSGENAGSTGGFTSTIKTGTVFQLPNIYYNFNDASIRPDARIDLDALAGFMNQYPDVEIELSSHTDSRGGSRYNKKLSQKRAENAVDYLISLGIDASRLSPVGYGEEQIRNHCTNGKDCTEDEHQYNRRTVVKITRMNEEINIQFVNDDSPPASSSSDYSYEDEVGRDHENINNGYASSGNAGDYVVIAGVYNQYKNAEKKLKRLVNKGYGQAEIKNVGSQYHIVVNRFSDREAAKSLQESLSNDNVDSYLKE